MRRKKELDGFDPDWDYTQDTTADRDHLDDEWMRQPDLFMKYAALSAQATLEYQEVHEEVKTLRSELIYQVRNDNPKAKNDEVEAYYRTDEDYKEAKQRMIRAEFVKNLLSGAVMAMHQKKASLEHLVILHGQGYFCEPRVRGVPIDQAQADHQKDTGKTLRKIADRKRSGRRRSGRKT